MAKRATRVDILFGLAYPDSRVRRAARALADAGYSVRVHAWDRSGRGPRVDQDGPVRIEHAQVRSRSGRGAVQLLYLARAVRQHLPSIRRHRPDVIHAVDLPMLAAALAVRHAAGGPCIVYDAFEIYALMEAHKYPRSVRRAIAWAEGRLPRLADLVITPGERRSAYFARRGIASVVVGNWVDPPRAEVDREGARASLGIAPDSFAIVYAGGLERSRDIDALLRHARRHPEHEVLVAGRGEQEPTVRSAAAELPNVRFLGWLGDPSVLYASADTVYYALHTNHPYSVHPAPNNLYAAIAHGVPLVHRGQGEIGELAGRIDLGERFDDDPSLDAAFDALRSPERQSSVRSALRASRTRFTARAAAAALVAAYPLPPTVTPPD